MSWTVDLTKREARHRSGLVVRFTPSDDGAFDGEAVAGFDGIRQDDAEGAARLMREAGEEFLAAIHARRREILLAVAPLLFGPLWQRELARSLAVSDRTVRRWAAGDGSVPVGALKDLAGIATGRATDIAKAQAILANLDGP